MNRFERGPNGSTDEEGEFAYVDVAAATDTADKARDWLVEHASEVLSIHPGEAIVKPEHIELRALGLSMERTGLLPDSWPVEHLVRAGLCDAWWRFDVSMAREADPAYLARHEDWLAAYSAEQKQHASDWRGPWWWRARCWLSQRILRVGARLEPGDLSSVSWRDGGRIYIAQVRRPR